MNPNFKDRDIVLSINYPRSLKNNDVVLLDLPNYGVVIKRIKSINGDDLKLAGDNKKSVTYTHLTLPTNREV